MLQKKPIDLSTIFYNATTLFGFITPYIYINTGAWSIGNEVFYYAITPILIVSYNKSVKLGNLLFSISVFASMIWSISFLNSSQPLATQWQNYINPINNLFLYCSGVALYYNKTSFFWKRNITLPLILIWALYPSSGNQITIVTGAERFIFSIMSVLTVVSFFNYKKDIPKILDVTLTKIGEATYGIYLLHPLIYELLKMTSLRLHLSIGKSQAFIFTTLLTIAVSLLIYKFLEKPLIGFGKKSPLQKPNKFLMSDGTTCHRIKRSYAFRMP